LGRVKTLPVPQLDPAASVLEAAKLMISEQSSEVFVVDENGRPVGVVRHVDIVMAIAKGMHPTHTAVDGIMLHPPPMVEEDATVGEVAKVLVKSEMRRILVAKDREVVGLLEAGELFDLVSASLESAEVFKAFSMRTRLRMAEILSVTSMSVDELADELSIKPITVRHHLDVLRRNGIIEEFQEQKLGKVGRPLSLFRTTRKVLKRATFPLGEAAGRERKTGWNVLNYNRRRRFKSRRLHSILAPSY